jgi:hypothetical protein
MRDPLEEMGLARCRPSGGPSRGRPGLGSEQDMTSHGGGRRWVSRGTSRSNGDRPPIRVVHDRLMDLSLSLGVGNLVGCPQSPSQSEATAQRERERGRERERTGSHPFANPALPSAARRLTGHWLMDGGRSAARAKMPLKMEGRKGASRFSTRDLTKGKRAGAECSRQPRRVESTGGA